MKKATIFSLVLLLCIGYVTAKTKIAVLGGGYGSLSTVHQLISEPDWQSKYDITVYEMSWRLGGKANSGRNLANHNRIEEHGIHSFFGIYEHAFRMVQDIYSKLNRTSDQPFSTWESVFFQQNSVVLQEYYNGRWIPWVNSRPYNSKVPGKGQILGDQYDFPRSVCNYTQLWQLNYLSAVLPILSHFPNVYEQFMAVNDDICGYTNTGRTGQVVRVLGTLQSIVHRELNRVKDNTQMRRLLLNTDYYITLLLGLIVDGTFEDGLEAINQYEATDWLRRHNMHPLTLSSPLVRQSYDLTLAYFQGNPDTPNIEAGTAVQVGTRLDLDFAGAPVWRLKGPMGDLIFGPIYQVLSEAGVKFKFFHKVQDLVLDSTKTFIQEIRMDVTATPTSGYYYPFVDVGGLPCWPSTPLYDQLQESQALIENSIDLESFHSNWSVSHLSLVQGQDFDCVVLGIPIGVFPYIAQELISANNSWSNMVSHIKTTASLSLQVWSHNTRDELEISSDAQDHIGSTYEQPMPTNADISVALPLENWPQSDESPKTLFYFTGTFSDQLLGGLSEMDADYNEMAVEKANELCLQWYKDNIEHLWPGVSSYPDSKWDTLVATPQAEGEDRFQSQFCRVNIEPQARYVLSVKGSSRYRLGQGESGFQNLVIVGDWTRTSLNAGAAESATESGVKGAAALRSMISA